MSIDDYTNAQWSALLINELDNSRPILYSGRDEDGGHCFVCDGYSNSGQFHFNWGWGGWCDGYYTIGNLHPASGGTGGNSTYTFNLVNMAIIGIEPNTSFGNTTTATATSSNSSYGTVTGSGTYTGTNTSTVTLTATAATGCRFTGWNDGCMFNPRTFYANGGSHSFSANFEPLSGDTLGYSQNHCITSLGVNWGTTNWGIKLPASVLTAGSELTKIQLYVQAAGSYTLTVYTGTTSPTTAVHTQNFSAGSSNVNHWGTLTLSSPVSIDGTSSLWITLSSSASYPAAVSYFCGNDDSRLWGSSLSPSTWNYSFMLRGIFADNDPPAVTGGDTLSYCGDSAMVNSAGAGGSLTWGVRFLPAALTGHDTLTDVRLFVTNGGNYTLSIYQGSTTSSATQVASQTFTFPTAADSSWQNCHLTTPVAINTTQPLWVVFSNSGVSYPAAMCNYTGDTNSSLVYLNNTWMSLYTAAGGSFNGSWLIQAITHGSGGTTTLGDTVDYCGDSTFSNSIGAGGSLTWGIRIPPAMHQHRQYLTDVMLYVPNAGTYNLNIYQGATTSSSTNVGSQSATFISSDAGMWKTIHLTSPVTLNAAQPLWITFSNNTVAYPAAICNITGDTNGSLVTFDNGGTWVSLYTASGGSLNGTWMIRAILSNSGTPSVSISGPASTGVGIPATFTVSGPTTATYSWQLNGATPSTATGTTITATWSNPGTYNVIVSAVYGGATLRDTLTVTVQSCTINTFPFTMGFEPTESLACWNMVDNDGDGYGWDYAPYDSMGYTGAQSFASASYINGVGALTPDNWLVTPPLQLTAGYGYTLSWHDGAVDPNYYDEHYSVYVSTTGNNVNNFTGSPVFQTTLTTANYTQRSVDLSSYAGQTIYIAFRHHNSEDVYWLLLDDISVTETAPQSHTLTVVSANPEMGTATGGGTYPHGSTVTITATANTGYHFTQWNDGNTNASRAVTVTADATYTAYFAVNEPDTYTITVLSANPEMGIVEGGGSYPAGTTVVLTARPFAGYHFLQWQDSDNTNPRTVTVTGDATYIATFQPDHTESIGTAENSCTIAALPGYVVSIADAGNRQIDIYDIVGRRICGTSHAAGLCQFTMPHTGVYLVAIEGYPLRRVVVIR